MSNAYRKSLVSDTMPSPISQSRTSLERSLCSSLSATQQRVSYNHALAAKQRALYLLNSALTSITTVDVDVTLAVVLLFIEFELIDSGRDNWKFHINGARTIIETLCRSDKSMQYAMSPLRRCLISNCLVYVRAPIHSKTLLHTNLIHTSFDILGSTLATSTGLATSDAFANGALSLLQDAEGNHCSSFPAILLLLVRTGAQLLPDDQMSSNAHFSMDFKREQARLLLYTAQSFNPLTWATNLQPRSPTTDLLHRTHIASAHRAGVCVYLSRVLLSLYPTTQLPHDLDSLVAEVITHLSLIPKRSALFTATTWPAFIAGAETIDRASQEWVATRFQELWEVEPWGLIKGALGALERIWAGRRSNGNRNVPRGEKGNGDWIADLKGSGVDWLIA
jgi:hypothetical protein